MVSRTIRDYASSKIQNQKLTFLFLLAIFAYCIHDGVILCPDSHGYIYHSAIRIGLYPLTISLFQIIFKGYGLQALVTFQLISSLSTSYMITQFLASTFQLPLGLRWLLLIFFTAPILMIGNTILSEGIAYPLFLLTSLFFLKGILHKNLKDLYFFSFFLFFLVFTRQQYLFFYGLAIVYTFLAYVFPQFFLEDTRKIQKKFFLSIILSCCTFFLSERTYHYIYHGVFAGTPFTGTQLVIRPLYLTTEDSYKILNTPIQQEFVKEAFKGMVEQRIIDKNSSYRSSNDFETYYNTLYHQIFSSLWGKILAPPADSKDNNSFKALQHIDQQTISVALQLIRSNFILYTKFYIRDIIRGFGGHIFVGFIFFMFIACFWNIIKSPTPNKVYLSFMLANLIHLGNISLVCLVEPPLYRYTYSTGVLLLSILIIMGYHLMHKNQPSKLDSSCVV